MLLFVKNLASKHCTFTSEGEARMLVLSNENGSCECHSAYHITVFDKHGVMSYSTQSETTTTVSDRLAAMLLFDGYVNGVLEAFRNVAQADAIYGNYPDDVSPHDGRQLN